MSETSTEKPSTSSGGSPNANEAKSEQPATSKTRSKKELRNEITHQLRFQILERDRYRCRYCGRSPKTDPSVELTIDHLIPIDRGGTNTESNLLSACKECNEGKKARSILHTPLDSTKKIVWDDIVPLLSGVGREPEQIKAFFNSPVSLPVRQKLFAHWKLTGEDGCIADCALCMDVHDSRDYYLGCFSDVLKFTATPVTQTSQSQEKVTAANILQCDNCYLAGRCPKYRMGSLCSFDFTVDTDFTDVTTAWKILINIQRERVMRAVLFEKVDGGVPDKNLTAELQMLTQMLQTYEERGNPSVKLNLEGKGQGASVVGNLLANIFKGAQSLPENKAKQLPEGKVTEAVVVPEKQKEREKKA